MSRNYRKRTGIGIIAFVVLILCGIVSFKRIELEAKSVENKLSIVRLNAQIKVQEERVTDLNNLKAYVQTKSYIEEIAREKLGLVYEDDIIFQSEDKQK